MKWRTASLVGLAPGSLPQTTVYGTARAELFIGFGSLQSDKHATQDLETA
jgi:hypothetical protein